MTTSSPKKEPSPVDTGKRLPDGPAKPTEPLGDLAAVAPAPTIQTEQGLAELLARWRKRTRRLKKGHRQAMQSEGDADFELLRCASTNLSREFIHVINQALVLHHDTSLHKQMGKLGGATCKEFNGDVWEAREAKKREKERNLYRCPLCNKGLKMGRGLSSWIQQHYQYKHPDDQVPDVSEIVARRYPKKPPTPAATESSTASSNKNGVTNNLTDTGATTNPLRKYSHKSKGRKDSTGSTATKRRLASITSQSEGPARKKPNMKQGHGADKTEPAPVTSVSSDASKPSVEHDMVRHPGGATMRSTSQSSHVSKSSGHGVFHHQHLRVLAQNAPMPQQQQLQEQHQGQEIDTNRVQEANGRASQHLSTAPGMYFGWQGSNQDHTLYSQAEATYVQPPGSINEMDPRTIQQQQQQQQMGAARHWAGARVDGGGGNWGHHYHPHHHHNRAPHTAMVGGGYPSADPQQWQHQHQPPPPPPPPPPEYQQQQQYQHHEPWMLASGQQQGYSGQSPAVGAEPYIHASSHHQDMSPYHPPQALVTSGWIPRDYGTGQSVPYPSSMSQHPSHSVHMPPPPQQQQQQQLQSQFKHEYAPPQGRQDMPPALHQYQYPPPPPPRQQQQQQYQGSEMYPSNGSMHSQQGPMMYTSPAMHIPQGGLGAIPGAGRGVSTHDSLPSQDTVPSSWSPASYHPSHLPSSASMGPPEQPGPYPCQQWNQ